MAFVGARYAIEIPIIRNFNYISHLKQKPIHKRNLKNWFNTSFIYWLLTTNTRFQLTWKSTAKSCINLARFYNTWLQLRYGSRTEFLENNKRLNFEFVIDTRVNMGYLFLVSPQQPNPKILTKSEFLHFQKRIQYYTLEKYPLRSGLYRDQSFLFQIQYLYH